MTLLFGCRDSETDHLYKVETLKLRLDGVLGNVNAAYSRQPGRAKVRSCCIILEIMCLSMFVFKIQ